MAAGWQHDAAGRNPPRVLVDTSALRRTKVADAGVFSKTVQLLGRETTIGVLGVRERPLPGPGHEWLRQQIEVMPTFARLAQEKSLSLCTYSELELEELHGSFVGSGVAGELLAGTEAVLDIRILAGVR